MTNEKQTRVDGRGNGQPGQPPPIPVYLDRLITWKGYWCIDYTGTPAEKEIRALFGTR